MNLYQLSTELEILQSQLTNQDLTDAERQLAEDRMMEILEQQGNKMEYILKLRANAIAQEKMIEDEIERLKSRLDPIKKIIERREQQIDESLRTNGIDSLEVWTYKLSYRKSESVEITDETLLPTEFVKTKVTTAPDKIAIKKAINDWQDVSGATIKTNLNLQIK